MAGGARGPTGLTAIVGPDTHPPQRVSLIERGVLFVLASEGVIDAELSVTLLADDEIRAINREHLGRDRPTDVIAFALYEEGEVPVGDVYLGFDRAVLQAEAEGIPLDEELLRLAIHGTLHVLGWSHPESAAARVGSPMFKRQEELVAEGLRRLG